MATLGGLDYPFNAVFDSSNGDIYVANLDPQRRGVSANITVVSGTSFVTNISVSPAPYGPLAYDPLDQYVYMVGVSGVILVIAGLTVIGTFPAGVNPTAVTFDPVGGLVYVAEGFGLDLNNDTVYGIAPSQHGRVNEPEVTLPLGSRVASGGWPTVFDPVNGHEYMEDGLNLTDIAGDSNSVAFVFHVGSLFNLLGPTMTVDPQTGTVYLADGMGAIGVLDPSAPLEDGSVTVNGTAVPFQDGNAILGLRPIDHSRGPRRS